MGMIKLKKILILFFMIISFSSFTKNTVITSIQPIYSLVNYLTEGTDIKVHSMFGSDVSMDTSSEAFEDKGLDLSIFDNAEAVVGLSRVWNEDKLYAKARTENINIIEIDAATSFDGLVNLLISQDEKGNINPYLWTNGSNIIKLANIVAKDLTRIYPKNKNKIEKNLANLNEKINLIDREFSQQILEINEDSIINLSKNLDYFINDLNIFSKKYNYDEVNEDTVEKIIKESNTKIFVGDRWLKKKVVKKIEELGGKFVYIETLNVPLDDNGQMDKDAILKAYKNNLENIINALK